MGIKGGDNDSVLDKSWKRLISATTRTRAFYALQLFKENIHSATYSLLLNLYYKNRNERNSFLQTIINTPTVMTEAE